MNDLQPDHLAHIFSYLPSVRQRLQLRQTCHAFHEALDRPTSWSNIRSIEFHDDRISFNEKEEFDFNDDAVDFIRWLWPLCLRQIQCMRLELPYGQTTDVLRFLAIGPGRDIPLALRYLETEIFASPVDLDLITRFLGRTTDTCELDLSLVPTFSSSSTSPHNWSSLSSVLIKHEVTGFNINTTYLPHDISSDIICRLIKGHAIETLCLHLHDTPPANKLAGICNVVKAGSIKRLTVTSNHDSDIFNYDEFMSCLNDETLANCQELDIHSLGIDGGVKHEWWRLASVKMPYVETIQCGDNKHPLSLTDLQSLLTVWCARLSSPRVDQLKIGTLRLESESVLLSLDRQLCHLALVVVVDRLSQQHALYNVRLVTTDGLCDVRMIV